MPSLAELIETRAIELGLDFASIANRDRFDGAPRHADPGRIMPGYQAIVSYGVAMSHGFLQS